MIYQNDIYPLVSDIVDKIDDLNQLANNASFKLDTLNQISNNTSFKIDTLNQLVNSASFKLDVSNQIASASSYKLDSLIQIGNISLYKLDMLYQGMDELNTHLDILALNAINNDNNNFTQMANLYINGVNALISGLNTWDKLDNITLLNAFLLKMASQIFEAININSSGISSILISSNTMVISAISSFYKVLVGEALKSNNYLQSLAAMNLMQASLLGEISINMIGLGQGDSGGGSGGLDFVKDVTGGLAVEALSLVATGALTAGAVLSGPIGWALGAGLIITGTGLAAESISNDLEKNKQEEARKEMADKQAEMMGNLQYLLDPATSTQQRDEAYNNMIGKTVGESNVEGNGMGRTSLAVPELELSLPPSDYEPIKNPVSDFSNNKSISSNELADKTIDGLRYDAVNNTNEINKVNSMLDETDVPSFGGNVNNNESKTEQPAITPNITINFGDVRETVDLDVVVEYLRKILVEEMGKTPEGVYYA